MGPLMGDGTNLTFFSKVIMRNSQIPDNRTTKRIVRLSGLFVPVEIEAVIKAEVATNNVKEADILRKVNRVNIPPPRTAAESKSHVGIIKLPDPMDLMIGTATKALIKITLVMMIYRSQFILIKTRDFRLITNSISQKLQGSSSFS